MRNLSKVIFLVIVSIAVLVACETSAMKRAKKVRAGKNSLVGRTKDEIMECAGVPARTSKTDTAEFLTYVSGGDSVDRRSNVGNINPSTGTYWGTGSSKTTKLGCEVTFVVKDGKVSRVSYSGNTSKNESAKGEQCYYAIQECLR